MVKIISFEGVHGSGKGTIISQLVKTYFSHLKIKILRDSEYPEFEKIKQKIREKNFINREQMIQETLKTRVQIYEKYLLKEFERLDIAILDRSYYTSAVWQSISEYEMFEIISRYEACIPIANKTIILYASPQVIKDRLEVRARNDFLEQRIEDINKEQEKFLAIGRNLRECINISNEMSSSNTTKQVYNSLNFS